VITRGQFTVRGKRQFSLDKAVYSRLDIDSLLNRNLVVFSPEFRKCKRNPST